MGHVDVNGISYSLPDGRPLLNGVSFRVGDGAKVALVGPNGTGKTTLLRIITGELAPDEGSIARSGGLGVMSQFIGKLRDNSTVGQLLISVAPQRVRTAADALQRWELAMMDNDDQATQLAYAQALADFGDAGGYEYQTTVWDKVTTTCLGVPFERCEWREVNTLSGGEQKRLVLTALLNGPDEVLLLDEPDNYLDVPAKLWLEAELQASDKTVLFVSHDRELLANSATAVVTVEPGAAGATTWTHPGSFATWHQARVDRNSRLEELRRRWDEEHAKLQRLVLRYKEKASHNADMASQYQAAKTRLAKFENAGPPLAIPLRQEVSMRLVGGRTARRAVICEGLELLAPTEEPGVDSLMKPFDAEIWYGDRVAILGSNGSGKSHFLRLLAAGGTRPEPEHQPIADVEIAPVRHAGIARLGSRVRPGWFTQTQQMPHLSGRTLLGILHRGDEHRDGMVRQDAARALDRYELAKSGEQTYDTLSGGQQARFNILLLELSGVTLLLLDEPTDNLDLHSAEALEHALTGFDGTILCVTHDRWFARNFDRFLVFGADGVVRETNEAVWDEGRVARAR